MSAEVKDVAAPFGLDFEMPQTVWHMQGEGTSVATFEIDGKDWWACYPTEADALARLMEDMRSEPDVWGELRVVAITFPEMQANARLTVGATLRDRQDDELGRRYFR